MRIVTLNALGLRGFPVGAGGPVAFPLPAGELVAELARRIAAWRADVVLLQEAPPEVEVREVARLAGMQAVFMPAQANAGPEWPFGFPGAVLARWPLGPATDRAAAVRAPGDARFQRHWGSVTVATPLGPLTATTTHLCADWGGVHRESTRLAEVAAILAAPPGDLIAADCNTRPGEAPWQALRGAGWRDAWLESGADGDGLTSDTRKRIQRIDYVWLAPGSPWRAAAAQVLPDDPLTVRGIAALLSDHHPVLVELAR